MSEIAERTVDRRRFLQGLGLGVAGAPLAACHFPDEDPYALTKPPVPGSDKVVRDHEERVATACAQCPASCGISVRVVGGRAVSVAGLEENPINQGGIGPRGLASLQVLYDPDRVRQPLKRKGARGSGEWEPVEWDEALATLGERLGGLRERGEPHRLGIMSGRQRGLLLDLWHRFARAYGTPNVFDGLARHHSPLSQAVWLTQGIREIPTYDWPNTRYVLSLGAGILESSCQLIYFSRQAATMRRGQRGTRAKVVQVEPSPSKTALQADEWISCKPGTHAAFALGLAHVLVREDLYDVDFVEQHCFGLRPWRDEDGLEHLGLFDLLARDYSPTKVATVCGVEASTIERLAHEMAAERPSVVVIDERATLASNGLHAAFAAQALNALLGSIDRPGGVLTGQSAPTASWAEVELDEAAEAGLAMPRIDGARAERHPIATCSWEALPEALTTGKPYELDTLLLHHANPVHTGMSPRRWQEALQRVPHVVSFTPFLDETALAVADLILPDSTFLERWEDAAPAPSVGFPVFGIRQPVVEPLHDTRPTGDVVLDLGREIGDTVEEALDWKDFRTVLFGTVKALHQAKRGTIVEKKYSNFGRTLFREGFWALPELAYERWDEVLRTPSGRFELASQHLWAALAELADASGGEIADVLVGWGRQGDPDVAVLPHQAPLHWSGDETEFPFILEVYSPSTRAEGGGANQPLLQDLRTERGHRPWRTTADVAPATAERLGLRSGDEIELRSPAGSIRVHVHPRPGMRADMVRVPRRGGHRAFGRFAQGWGGNVQELLVPVTEPFGGAPAFLGTRVSIRRIG